MPVATPPVAAPASTPPEPQPAAAPPDTNAGRGKKIAGLAVGIVGVAAVGAGIACSILAKQAADDLTKANQNGQPFDKSKYNAGKAEDIAGPVLMAVGGAAVVAGVIVGVLGVRESKPKSIAFIPWLGTNGGGALVEVRW
jgi:hypothetical protein